MIYIYENNRPDGPRTFSPPFAEIKVHLCNKPLRRPKLSFQDRRDIRESAERLAKEKPVPYPKEKHP